MSDVYDISVDDLITKTKDEISQLHEMKRKAATYYLSLCRTIQNREELLKSLGEGPPVFSNNI